MRRSAYLLAVVGFAALAGTASASVIFTSTITAHNTDTGAYVGSETWQFEVPSGMGVHDLVSDGWGAWEFGPENQVPGEYANPRNWGSGAAMVHGVGVAFREDPQVVLNFNVQSGFMNMTFTVDSSIVSFAPIASATGYASAFIGLTDSSFIGTPGSMTLAGLQGGNQAYAARYNNGPINDFTTLISGGTFTGANGFSTSLSGNFGTPGSMVPVAPSVFEIRSQFRFSLTAGDRASGTSVFEVVPAPGAAALFGIAGLIVGRRRR